MCHIFTVVCEVLVVGVAREKHALVEESLVNREDLGYGVDEGQTQQAVWEKLTS